MPALFALDDDALLAHCRVKQVKSKGPGGQHAQKNATAIQLYEPEFDIEVRCQDFREVEANRKRALREMRIRLAVHQRGFGSVDDLSKVMHDQKIKCNVKSEQFPKVVAILLDLFDQHGYEVANVAQHIQSSSSQIINLFKQHKYVFSFVQRQRASLGLKKLH